MNGSALVTGGGGFLGRHLVRRLTSEGWQVYDLDFANRPPRESPPGAVALRAARLEAAAIQALLPAEPFTAVFHLAAAGVAPHDRDPRTLVDSNVLLGHTLLEALRDRRPGSVVITGSCSEYAEGPAGVPLTESMPLSATDLYGASKAAGTLWSLALARHWELNATAVRIFHIYGPGEAPHRLVSGLVRDLRCGRPVEMSPGDQKRDLLYVDDVVSGLLAAAGAAPGGVYNLCSGAPVTVREVAHTAARVLDRPADLLRFGALPYRPGEPLWLVGNPDRFQAATGWKPVFTLEAGIRAMMEAS
jgi:nucleoside-diphosphate-sugar epimerase